MSDAFNLTELWQQTVEHLGGSQSGPALRTWLDETAAVGFSDDTVVLAAPHSFARDQLDNRFGGELRSALSMVAGQTLNVVVTVRPDAAEGGPLASENGASPEADAPIMVADPPRTTAEVATSHRELSEKYTFDRFVIGPSNRFAHAAAFAVAEAPAKAYNPLFIYGGAGLGKTHLVQAIGHYTLRLYPQSRVRYVTSERFTNEFIDDVISNRRRAAFQRRYRDVDVLIIDDIQFLENKEGTKEEFFHTFNALHQAEKQIVVTCDRPPKQLGQLEERLRTRFEMGLLTDVQPPDLETRLAILRKKSAYEHLSVPDEVLEVIASRISSNIRELEGALLRVTAAASLGGTEITLPMVEMTLKDLFPDTQHAAITVGLIINETAAYFGIAVEELCSTSRTRQLVTARQAAMYLTRELTEMSLPKIGQAFGGRDHTTVMHAVSKITQLIHQRAPTFHQLQEITARIKARASATA